jgi:hypothetical protein
VTTLKCDNLVWLPIVSRLHCVTLRIQLCTAGAVTIHSRRSLVSERIFIIPAGSHDVAHCEPEVLAADCSGTVKGAGCDAAGHDATLCTPRVSSAISGPARNPKPASRSGVCPPPSPGAQGSRERPACASGVPLVADGLTVIPRRYEAELVRSAVAPGPVQKQTINSRAGVTHAESSEHNKAPQIKIPRSAPSKVSRGLNSDSKYI